MEAYISAAPKEAQGKLREIREAIKQAAPTAKESIRYGMSYYDYKGRLAWFGLAKAHVGLYLRPPIIAEHKKELAGYGTTKSAVHLPLDEKLPVPLIMKLVKARMKKTRKNLRLRRPDSFTSRRIIWDLVSRLFSWSV